MGHIMGLWASGAVKLDVQFTIFIFCLEIPLREPQTFAC